MGRRNKKGGKMSEVTTYHGNCNSKNSIILIWHIEDVKYALSNIKEEAWFVGKYGHTVKLTDEDCMEILEDVESHHDASMGVSWDTIEFYIGEFLDNRCI